MRFRESFNSFSKGDAKMRIDVSWAKIPKGGFGESGDTIELVERPLGGGILNFGRWTRIGTGSQTYQPLSIYESCQLNFRRIPRRSGGQGGPGHALYGTGRARHGYAGGLVVR